MYLVAIKSILHRVGYGRVIQIDDNSLTENDRVVLQRHLPGSTCIPITSVDTGACPRGGTWERLCHIVNLLDHSYVIQVDADTLVCGDIPEVLQCVQSNRSFTLGTRQGQALVSARKAASFAHEHGGNHTQLVAERALGELPNADELSYVRGSSGFAGFARGAFSRSQLQEFSTHMSRMTGSRWHEWGTEQVSSNFVVANSPLATVLPYPKYACFDLNMDPNQAAFLHFIGTNRFDHGTYAARSRDVIAQLRPG